MDLASDTIETAFSSTQDPIDPHTESKGRMQKVDPKKTARDALHTRVVVVSPYSQHNVFLETLIPDILSGGEVDVVSEAESDDPPYIEVPKREQKAQRPLWIIDFGKILAKSYNLSMLYQRRLEAFRDEMSRQLANQYKGVEEYLRRPDVPLDAEVLTQLAGNLSHKLQGFNLDLTQLSDALHLAEQMAEKDAIHPVPFKGYSQWAARTERIYIRPKTRWSSAFESNYLYDESGNFLPGSVPLVPQIAEMMRGDLEVIAVIAQSGLRSDTKRSLTNTRAYLATEKFSEKLKFFKCPVLSDN